VLVIDSNGEKLGVLPTGEALRRAQEQNLNLVEVAPNVRPPVCKILDYGRYKYDLKQDAKRKKKNQVVVELKEVKWRPKVDIHDFDFKVRHVIRFLRDGNKVKCTIMFRGREMAHTEIGTQVLMRVLDALERKVNVESPPKLEGRNMSMLISPKQGAWKPLEKKAAAPVKGADSKAAAPLEDEKGILEPLPDEPDLPDDDDDEGEDSTNDDGEVTASV
jgi:translation initiation factor IF-3